MQVGVNLLGGNGTSVWVLKLWSSVISKVIKQKGGPIDWLDV